MSKAIWIALAALAAVAVGAGAASADPLPSFLQQTIAEDLSQILVGQLAGRTADSPQVREFGRALAEDHTAIELKAIDLASAKGVPQPSQATDAGRQQYRRLQTLTGHDFDNAFLAYAAAALRQDIAAFKAVAADKKSPAAALAKEAVAMLEKDLKTAEGLRGGS